MAWSIASLFESNASRAKREAADREYQLNIAKINANSEQARLDAMMSQLLTGEDNSFKSEQIKVIAAAIIIIIIIIIILKR
jgi:hypothetical protein